MEPKFVLNEPVLYIEKIKSIVIADLHIGIEYELAKNGIKIPKQTNLMIKKIKSVIEKTKTKKLIILGDIKHQVPGINFFEQKEIPEFFEQLKSFCSIKICLGNHDTFIKELIPEGIEIYDSKGFVLNGYGFFHGHAWPDKKLLKCKWIITSHIHPTLLFTDKFGHRIIEPVWIKCLIDKRKIKEKYGIDKKYETKMIILPAFNKILSGSNINVLNIKYDFIEPLMIDMINKDRCELYLLDGTFIGKLSDMK
ncbi:MAG: metallophosphoesterase [Candidatus Aenigmatarchaeota archaeon]|nr:metallophosphoesterase [Candidatus Aenigmarchaeota archaeon]